ncbi:allophanate hydrolase [Methylocaldum sp. RMAD-M]|jgi:allophanate hydrolase|uniref:allophanate hydrolase n=1 Tax=Methylocaldum sp. RMAD-M TaxID=2806557 RepID=UPI000A3219BF|nr:allophanate hydrolase [Methylocaldum sp. RMAD-M]MBP1151191.1 allophanate hydrolase [Methylocaldum sp. RMAD-M]
MTDNFPASLDIETLSAAYRQRRITPVRLIEGLLARMDAEHGQPVWIYRLPADEVLRYAHALEQRSPAELPLYGIPFAIKDNIDLAGTPTTAACPAYAYRPEQSAFAVRKLIEAGAIPIGKTNLDQFATGLTGTRSPYGACPNAFDPGYISGGSSSGSAVAVAKGWVSFALGTDTAGSGRVPAAFNNLVGLKPTPGLISTSGVVPACRSLDCVSIFALTAGDARRVFRVVATFDPSDPYARCDGTARPEFAERFRFGVPRPDQLEFFGDKDAERLFAAAAERLEAIGGRRIEIDFAPFLETARLLYEGPWVAERYLAIRDLLDRDPDAVYPVTRTIIERGKHHSASDTFAAFYRLMALKRAAEEVWTQADIILTPTTGTIYRLAEVEADPVRLNSNLGYYTNFMNLICLAAVAVPGGFNPGGLPFGITLFAPAGSDHALLNLAERLHYAAGLTMGATGQPLPAPSSQPEREKPGHVRIAVCGAHLSGLPLNGQLTRRRGRLVKVTRTAPSYRLYALPDGKRPGLLRQAPGAAIEVEVWELPVAEFGGFVAEIPAPLGIGSLELEDGECVQGFLCEAYAVADALDITGHGEWKSYLRSRDPA